MLAVVMVVFIDLFDGRAPQTTSNGRIGPEGRQCLDRLPATASPAFFPCRQGAAFLAEQKSRLPPSSASASGLTAAGRSLPGPRTAIEAAMVAARQQRNTIMATIGTFTAADNGYTGSVKMLTLNVKAKFVATEKDNDKAPDYRVFAGTIECGAAWKKTARETDREYLSVKLDDACFPAPIYASLVKAQGDDSFTLIWSRRTAE
jgi:uncharacterized protein (DUF736 family)